jgi:hypothetical protein
LTTASPSRRITARRAPRPASRPHRPAGIRLARAAALCAALALLAQGGERARAAHAPFLLPFRLETRRVADRHGHPLYLQHYRPFVRATGVVLLAHDWLGSGASCWGDFPRELVQAGFEVLVPDLPGHGLSVVPELLRPSRSRPTRGELQHLREIGPLWWNELGAGPGNAVIVCAGWSGLCAPGWLPAGRTLKGIVWIDPRGEARAWADELRAVLPDPPPLLFLATRENIAGSRIAEGLYTRFNRVAQLRLFTHGEGGCTLARQAWLQTGLREWIAAAVPAVSGAGERGTGD